MTFSWSETKDIFAQVCQDSKVTHWLMERAHEEGMRPVEWSSPLLKTRVLSRDLMEKIEQGTARAVMSMVVA